MGMFDYVRFPCPECREIIEEQSKAGPCLLNSYSLESAPPEVLADLADDDNTWCEHCHTKIEFISRPRIVYEVAAIKHTGDDW